MDKTPKEEGPPMNLPNELAKEIAALPERFYGSVEISFQDGLPVVIKTLKTQKIFNERDNRRDYQQSR
jgi:hypothetical protein